MIVLFTEHDLPKHMNDAAWDFATESVDKKYIINDFEFVEYFKEIQPY